MYSLFLVSTVLPWPMICHSSCLLGTYREFALVFFDVQSVFYSIACNTIVHKHWQSSGGYPRGCSVPSWCRWLLAESTKCTVVVPGTTPEDCDWHWIGNGLPPSQFSTSFKCRSSSSREELQNHQAPVVQRARGKQTTASERGNCCWSIKYIHPPPTLLVLHPIHSTQVEIVLWTVF